MREAEEETSLKVELFFQLGAYQFFAGPEEHTIPVVFGARAEGKPGAADDAEDIGIFDLVLSRTILHSTTGKEFGPLPQGGQRSSRCRCAPNCLSRLHSICYFIIN